MEQVENILWEGRSLAIIIRAEIAPQNTTFFTPSDLQHQVGFVVYPRGGEIQRHVHLPVERRLVGTSEVLVVRRGRCEIDIYNDERTLVVSRELHTGDIVVLVAGGHGFRMLDDTVLIEVKQGPYTGLQEKERF